MICRQSWCDQQRRLGRSHGARHEGRLDPKTIFDMISNGAGNSACSSCAPMMVKNHYDQPTMKCSVWQKDMDVIGPLPETVPTPVQRDAGLRRGAEGRPRRATPLRSVRCWKPRRVKRRRR
jgi:hypothetical protein